MSDTGIFDVACNGDYAFVTIKGWKSVSERLEFFTEEDLINAYPELQEEISLYWPVLDAQMKKLNAMCIEEYRQAREEHIAMLKNDGCYYDRFDDD